MSAQFGLVRSSVRLTGGLKEEFQRVVRERFGKLKGAQEVAINDAVKLWLGHAEGRRDIFVGTVVIGRKEQFRVFFADELIEAIKRAELKYASLTPGNSQGSIDPEIVQTLIDLWRDADSKLARKGKIYRSLNSEEVNVKLLDEFEELLFAWGGREPFGIENTRSALISRKRIIYAEKDYWKLVSGG